MTEKKFYKLMLEEEEKNCRFWRTAAFVMELLNLIWGILIMLLIAKI